MRLLTLADDCRRAGLEVVELAGWQQRGPDLGQVGAILSHHTASGPGTSDAAVDRLLRDGRPASGATPALPGPLAQVGLDRQGRVRLIAAGRANHAGTGSWRGVSGNGRAVGVEAYNDGRGEPWPAAQLDAWDLLNGVLLRTCDLPAGALCGHKEWAPTRKIDPYGLDMNLMRARAARILNSTDEDDDMPLTPDDRAMIRADVHDIVLEVLRKEGVSGAAPEIAALRAVVAAQVANGDLTAQQVQDAAQAGAAAAIDARIDSARVEITPKEQQA